MRIKKILFVFILLIMVITISGCDKKEEIYTKDVDTYFISHSNVNKNISFEFVKNDDYIVKKTNGSIRLYNENDKSKIELYFYYDYPDNKTVTKQSHDFTLESYHDFKKVKINGHEGWSIYQTIGDITNYEIDLKLTEPNDEGLVYAVDIKVIQSLANKEFDTVSFVEGEDFVHLLNSLNVVEKVIENIEDKSN